MDHIGAAAASGQLVEQAWRAHRPYLVNLAYSMLRDVAGAEDAAQEAFARLTGAEVEDIEDVRGWLIVVTSRICLDRIGSAPARREVPGEPAVLERLGRLQPERTVDPADRATLDDEVRLALMVVLQRLTPPERVAFVLHDVFGLPFGTVARAIGRPAPTCRQLAHRARTAVHTGHPRAPEVGLAQQRLVTDRFLSACANGDLEGLLGVLAPDVHGDVDLGPTDRRSGLVVHGAQAVARNVLRYFGPWTTLAEPSTVGSPTLVAFVARRLYAVISLTCHGGAVTDIHVTADPAKLAHLATFV